jgi:predicted RNA-binding Zn-ribbon protein involved in translation (DUF1610 family)
MKNKNMVKLHIYPIERNDNKYCPVCETEIHIVGKYVGMMDSFRLGNEGWRYKCPKCGWSYVDIYLYRD